MYYVRYLNHSPSTRETYNVQEDKVRYTIVSYAGPFRSLQEVEDFLEYDATEDDTIEVLELGG